MAGGGGRLYRWIKAVAPGVPTLVHDPDDPEQADDGVRVGTRRWLTAFQGGPAAVARTLGRHWRRLWQRETKAPLPEEWMAALDGLPAFPHRAAWNVARLRALIKRMGTRKVPGLDGRYAAELAALPDELLSWLCELFDLVEE
eukprot:5266945-Lingulodinium_polyedra.AAC.1